MSETYRERKEYIGAPKGWFIEIIYEKNPTGRRDKIIGWSQGKNE